MTTPSVIMKFAAIFITLLFGASNATFVVNCKDGDAFDNSESPKSLGKTCFEECNNGQDCCGGGPQACDYFTGKVAKDGSCMGAYGKTRECLVQLPKFGNASYTHLFFHLQMNSKIT